MSETHGQSQEQVVRKEGTGGREAVCVGKGPVASGYGIYGLNSLFLPGEVSPSWCGIVPSPQLTRPVILEKCCVKIPTPLLPDCPFPPTQEPVGRAWTMNAAKRLLEAGDQQAR